MAHKTRDEIDAQARAHSQATTQELPPEPPAETALTIGASGANVSKLVDLLALLGYATNTVIKGGPPVLDESIMVDVRAAIAAHDLPTLHAAEGLSDVAKQLPLGIEGEVVTQSLWNGLYAVAEQDTATS
jgi:hypothetical protein